MVDRGEGQLYPQSSHLFVYSRAPDVGLEMGTAVLRVLEFSLFRKGSGLGQVF